MSEKKLLANRMNARNVFSFEMSTPEKRFCAKYSSRGKEDSLTTPTSNSSIAIRNFGMSLLNNQWQPDRRRRFKK